MVDDQWELEEPCGLAPLKYRLYLYNGYHIYIYYIIYIHPQFSWSLLLTVVTSA